MKVKVVTGVSGDNSHWKRSETLHTIWTMQESSPVNISIEYSHVRNVQKYIVFQVCIYLMGIRNHIEFPSSRTFCGQCHSVIGASQSAVPPGLSNTGLSENLFYPTLVYLKTCFIQVGHPLL